MSTVVENVSSRPSIKNLPAVHSVVAEAMTLFPTSIHQRLIHYSRHCTYRNIALGRNPSMAVVDFIGSHGEGKTAIMADYVLKCAGVSTQTHTPDEVRNTLSRHLTVVSGGGITDVADITGLSYIDKETKTTRTARAANFGYEPSPWRLVLIDD